jgi:hypothetical protein
MSKENTGNYGTTVSVMGYHFDKRNDHTETESNCNRGVRARKFAVSFLRSALLTLLIYLVVAMVFGTLGKLRLATFVPQWLSLSLFVTWAVSALGGNRGKQKKTDNS